MSDTNAFLRDIASRISVINRVLHDDMPSSDAVSEHTMTVLRQEYDTLRRNMQRIPRPVGVPATADEPHITAKRRGWGYVRRPVGVPATVYEPAVTVRKKRKSRSKTNSKTRSKR